MAENVIHGAWAAAQQREAEIAEARRNYLRLQYAPFTPPDETPVTLHCQRTHGWPAAEGHVEQFTGVGWEATEAAAKAAGWVRGATWVCPACASDPTPVPVVKVQLEGFDGPCVHMSIDAALEEVRELLVDGNEEDDVITITRAIMTRGAVNSLREFDGY